MKTETNRHEFEEWVITKLEYSVSKYRLSEEYISDAVEVAWEAWQAARERQTRPMQDACELIADIMRDEVNIVDECEKFLRAYAPQLLFPPTPPTSEKI
jgi:hypothetical protein